LRTEDITRHPDGFWTMRITPEAGNVKGNTARAVPLHEHLIEQGFIEFAKAKGKGPLFYDPAGRRKVDDDPTNPARRPWAKSRDKLSEWVRSLGVTDPGICPNHAWRHTFKRIAARAGIERRIRFGFCDEGDRYETPSVEDLAVEGYDPTDGSFFLCAEKPGLSMASNCGRATLQVRRLGYMMWCPGKDWSFWAPHN
jgi:hypothetical protein